MPITRKFTDENDSYTVRLTDTYALEFLAGDDRLVTFAGTTTAYMGAGADYVRVSGGTATIWGGDGADRIDLYSGAMVDGGADADRFNFLADSTGTQASGGLGDDLFVGYSHAISGMLSGGDGNDRFLNFGNHGGRVVTLAGGLGNDLYRLDGSSPATVQELAGQGTDTVQITGGASYTLGANLEYLVALDPRVGSGITVLTGNALANRITGSSGSETLSGLAGNDTLYGNAGQDILMGGDGNDRINGGLGGDMIYGGAGRDVFVYSSVADSPATPSYDDQDWIRDWSFEDRIDLSAIDANELVAGNQAFQVTSVLFGAPSGPQPAGSAVLAGFGGELYVMLYTDADTDPDMIIALWSDMGESALTPSNLIL